MKMITKKIHVLKLCATPNEIKQRLGYKSVQAIYVWPDSLPLETQDRVLGAMVRTGRLHLSKESADELRLLHDLNTSSG